jgi:mannose-6-phosphate isomerase-like protein (cupin superfamily)
MDFDVNGSKQVTPLPAQSVPEHPAMHNFCSLQETVHALAARSAEAETAGKVAPLFMGQFLSAGVLRISNGSLRLHRQPNHEELLLVLEGEADFRVGSEVRRIRTGDFIVVPRNTVHGCEAIHSDALSFLSIISPEVDLARDLVWEDGAEPPRYQLI